MQTVHIIAPKARQLNVPYSPGVYVIFFKEGIKVGLSATLAKRILSYFVPWSKPILSVFYIETQDFVRAEEIALEEYNRTFLKDISWRREYGNREYFPLDESRTEEVKAILIAAVERAEQEYKEEVNTLGARDTEIQERQ